MEKEKGAITRTEKLVEAYKDLFRPAAMAKILKKNIDDFIESSEDKALVDTLNQYIKNATNGNLNDRFSFKEYLKVRFLTDLNIYREQGAGLEQTPFFNVSMEQQKQAIDYIIPFSEPDKMSAQDLFEILLFKYQKINENGYDLAFKKLKEKYSFMQQKALGADYPSTNIWYECTEEFIREIYEKESPQLSFPEKVEIIIQRLYEDIYGLGCIDILAYSDVNEVGISNDGQYIYCWADDKIYLSFLKLSEDETRLIQERSISFGDKPGQLCASTPEVDCYRADNARITAFQQPYFSARNLCIRIFNKRDYRFRDIVKNAKQQLLIQTLIKAGMKISLQGSLGAGKTTAMQVLLEVMDDKLHIGTVEDYFEQHNALKYPDKRIIEAQVIEGKSLLDAVMSLFRASIDVASVGEARDGEAVFAFIQLAQAIGNSAMFTSHVAAPEDTVPRYKNMLISTNRYFSEQATVMDIIQYINVIFQCSIINNVRCISQIVEIVPFVGKSSDIDLGMEQSLETLQKMALLQQIQQSSTYMYRLNPLLVLEQGEYRFKNYPSKRTIQKAMEHEESARIMKKLLQEMEKELKEPLEGEWCCEKEKI